MYIEKLTDEGSCAIVIGEFVCGVQLCNNSTFYWSRDDEARICLEHIEAVRARDNKQRV